MDKLCWWTWTYFYLHVPYGSCKQESEREEKYREIDSIFLSTEIKRVVIVQKLKIRNGTRTVTR